MVMVLTVWGWVGKTVIQSDPLIFDCVLVARSKSIKNHSSRDGNARCSIELAGRDWHLDCLIVSVLSIACALKHVVGLCPRNIAQQLSGLLDRVYIFLCHIFHATHVSIENDFEVSCLSAQRVIVDCLEAMVWHLV